MSAQKSAMKAEGVKITGSGDVANLARMARWIAEGAAVSSAEGRRRFAVLKAA